MRHLSFVAAASACLVLNGGCGKGPSTPDEVALPPGTHQSLIAAVLGDGVGGLSVTPKSIPQATFVADIKVLVRGARPNTSYIVQRAPEIGRPLSSDGICQRALGLSPWTPAAGPVAAAFLTFPSPGSPLMTSANGDGALDFEFSAASIPAGTVFDVMFRLVDDTASPTTELRSGCFTVMAR
jgi:hypothetical protein